jgi:hypothetical protein
VTIRKWVVWSVPIEGDAVRVGSFEGEPSATPAQLAGFARAGARDALVIQREEDGPPVTRSVYAGRGESWRGNQDPHRRGRRKRKGLAE